MENNKSYYCTYRFYDDRGRRLSIFAEKEDVNHLKITVFTCSKKDRFSKKKGREIFESWRIGENATEVSPKVHFIEFLTGKPKKSFIEWCRINYACEMNIGIVVSGVVLMKNGEIIRPDVGTRLVFETHQNNADVL